MPTVKCSLEGCNKAFHKPKSQIKVKNYCCRKHYSIARTIYPHTKIIYCNYCLQFKPCKNNNHKLAKYCSRKCSSASMTHKLEQKRAAHRKKGKRRRDNLSGTYLRRRIKLETGLEFEDITPELLELKKAILTIKRQHKIR